jgi:cell division septum initiation protein DivIVA
MDILHLVDRLEEIFNAGRPVPFTHRMLVDEDRVLEIIDQMRVSIPEEVKKAQQVLDQRDRILAKSQEEAARTIQLAKEKADQMVDREALVNQAQTRADQIIQNAKGDAEAIHAEADDYALGSLSDLEVELTRVLTQVRNGIVKLKTERLEPSPEGAPPKGEAAPAP